MKWKTVRFVLIKWVGYCISTAVARACNCNKLKAWLQWADMCATVSVHAIRTAAFNFRARWIVQKYLNICLRMDSACQQIIAIFIRTHFYLHRTGIYRLRTEGIVPKYLVHIFMYSTGYDFWCKCRHRNCTKTSAVHCDKIELFLSLSPILSHTGAHTHIQCERRNKKKEFLHIKIRIIHGWHDING